MELKIPEPICNKCNKLIEEGRPFCYECMSCIQCSPECFENEIDLYCNSGDAERRLG